MSAKRSQASAKRPRRVGHAGESTESKIVANRRTVVTFYVSHCKSVNSHRDRGVVVAKPRTVVTFGLVLRLRDSKVSTVTGSGGVVVAKPRTVVTFRSTVTGIGGVVVAKPRTVGTFGLASGERKGERREEKREMRGDRREKRGEKREEGRAGRR